jgi:hypothetical protein
MSGDEKKSEARPVDIFDDGHFRIDLEEQRVAAEQARIREENERQRLAALTPEEKAREEEKQREAERRTAALANAFAKAYQAAMNDEADEFGYHDDSDKESKP